MANPCVAETCSITDDTTNGVLTLGVRLKPDGGLECVGDGTGPSDGVAVHRFLDASNPPVAPAAAQAESDCLIPIQVTTDGQVFAYIPKVFTKAFPAGNKVDIIIGTSNPSVTISHTNNTNCAQLCDFRCGQPQIQVRTIAGGDTPTHFEGFVTLDSNLANANGVTAIRQRNDKTFLSPGASNEMFWYHLLAGVYIVQPGQTLNIDITVTATDLSNLDTTGNRGFQAIRNHMIIYPHGEAL
jgi:hypothetical protein